MDLLAIEMTSTPNIDDNFAVVEAQLKAYCDQRDDDHALVLLPESFALFGGSSRDNVSHMESLGEGPISKRLSALAAKYDIYLAGGTIPTRCEVEGKFQATLPLFDPKGQLLADYQKIHLFDVDVSDKTQQYRESDTTAPGEKVVSLDIQGITVGLAVCYDVRFSGLFGRLNALGAQVLLLPSAFTVPTGEAHWHSLLRARAIENQAFVVAAGQSGIHANGRETYGHSMIVDPWGAVAAEYHGSAPGYIRWRFDAGQCAAIGKKMPVKQHNRFVSQLSKR